MNYKIFKTKNFFTFVLITFVDFDYRLLEIGMCYYSIRFYWRTK